MYRSGIILPNRFRQDHTSTKIFIHIHLQYNEIILRIIFDTE